ncbi:MAG: helix-turn-helix domain-containing protein [Monoglobales bacterium]
MDKLIKKYQKHIASAFDIDCNLFDISLKCFDSPSSLYCLNCPEKCDFINTHLYGCYESVRWDNKYIYYCPCGYIFIAVPVFDDMSVFRTGVICGPILMGDPDDFINSPNLPNLSTKKVNDVANIVSAMFVPKISKIVSSDSKEDFLNTIYKELELVMPDNEYPFELEKELQKSIVEHDNTHSRELLNKLLGQIFFYSNGDLKIIKARVIELISLLSRSVIEAGADIYQILSQNTNYISEIESFDSLEQLSIWLSGIIRRFVDYVFEFNAVKHADVIYKITAYIKNNYMHKISLDDIAKHVYLSKIYVSKIFKEEMKIALSDYINKTRIEKSTFLLLNSSLSIADVANMVGYKDQSYFTKNFIKIIGVSPGKYKNKHGKI